MANTGLRLDHPGGRQSSPNYPAGRSPCGQSRGVDPLRPAHLPANALYTRLERKKSIFFEGAAYNRWKCGFTPLERHVKILV